MPTDLIAAERERLSDAHFLGAGGKLYPPGTPLDRIEPVLPDNGVAVVDRVFQVNGIMTDVARHMGDMQALANTGAAVIGVHNASCGLISDIREYLSDKIGRPPSATVRALADLIGDAVERGVPLHLVGHSQGALMISRALFMVGGALREKHGPECDAAARLSILRVETYGGGAHQYADGPCYVHVDNHLDPVSQFLGLGVVSKTLNWKTCPGKDAVIHHISDLNPEWPKILRGTFSEKGPWLIDKLVHGPRTIYFPRRVPFEQARRGVIGPKDRSRETEGG